MISGREGTPRFPQLTVYSGVINPVRGEIREQANVLAKNLSSATPFRLNLVLAFLMLAMVLGYIFLSNLLVSQKYLLSVRKQQFNQISTGLQAANAEINSAREMENLLLFAQTSGMIEAKDTSFILEEGGVALSDARQLP